MLSICISTFNRAAFIAETLECILSQSPDNVEILIVDGASTDNTESVIRPFLSRHPQIRYQRQEKNQGIDRDFDAAVVLARGKYCWLFSDDDLLKPGTVDLVLQKLSSGTDLLILNAEIRNADLRETIRERSLRMTSDRFYSPEETDTLMAETADYLSFIGCVIVRRSLWLERERERYYGSFFIHVGVIFQERLANGALVIAAPMIIIRYGNATWTSRAFEILHFKWPELIWSFSGISEQAKSAVCPKYPWRSVRRLMFDRAKGMYSIAEYRKLIASRCNSISERLLFSVISLLPGMLLNLVLFGYFRMRYTDPRFAVFELKNSRFYFRKS
ncbi:MAG TPA: glycosyltransferase family 2 protein [Candidatus Deferrimicrobiaceae bacterium]|jgi:glycosyltransferase involved in cell wall biosynthesis